MTIKINPEYEQIVPKISDIEYLNLKDSISKEGLHYPIAINEKGIVLDGHHRFKACQELKLEPRTIVKKFDSKLLEKKFVITSNLIRRHLTQWQKAELGLKLEPIESELAEIRMKSGKTLASGDARGKSTGLVAKQIGLSQATFERAKFVKEKASSQILTALKNNKLEIGHAYREVQKEIARNNAPKVQIPKEISVQVFNCDFEDLLNNGTVKANSIDLILTDPPYAKEFESEWNKLAQVAPIILKEGGHLVSFVGSLTFEMGFEALRSSGLKFEHLICLELNEMHQHLGKYFNEWRPIAVFYKGKCETKDHYSDRIRDSHTDKRYHDWQQSIESAEALLEHFSRPNDLVFEPFTGGGSFIQACIDKKRNVIAAEIEKKQFVHLKRFLE